MPTCQRCLPGAPAAEPWQRCSACGEFCSGGCPLCGRKREDCLCTVCEVCQGYGETIESATAEAEECRACQGRGLVDRLGRRQSGAG